MVELVKFDTKMNIAAIWVLAKREILAFWRNRARVISVFAQSIMFLLIFSMGFAFISIKIEGISIDSRAFVASGIIAIMILFTGVFGGLGLMRDKMFGFMKEMIVAPVSRRTLMVGRTLGISLQCVFQTLIILMISIIFGFFGYDISLIWKALLIIPVALLVSIGIVGLGLTISTRMRDFHSFGLIQTFIVMPMFWLSGAMFAFNNVPVPMQIAMIFNPYTYSVDLFRAVLLGVSFFPVWLDLLVVSLFGLTLIVLGGKSFNKMELN
ncbi:MAG: ABC transporter permease [Candidatus Hermodarchaeota archaeon]